jgi:predicted lipid-binding transport protein (Tim44 family)
MTILIGASVLLIAGSAVALVFGWTGADQTLIWTSIAATAAAAVTLALAYFRSRHEPAPSQGASPAQDASRPTSSSTATATQIRPEEAATSRDPEATAPARGSASEDASADEKPAEPPATEEVPAAAPAPRAKPTVRKMEVVTIASTKKFHRPECRYASSSGAEKMSKGEARKQGFAPCGVCKP